MKNLLFLLADQFRFDALGAENPLVQTPHLDALAEAGARFTRAYTPLPVCAPARQALYTGRHPDSFGAYWNYGFFPHAAHFAGRRLAQGTQSHGLFLRLHRQMERFARGRAGSVWL